MSDIQLMTIPQVAGRLEVSRSTVYRLIERGDLPVVNLGAGASKSRIRSDHLNQYIERLTRRVAA